MTEMTYFVSLFDLEDNEAYVKVSNDSTVKKPHNLTPT